LGVWRCCGEGEECADEEVGGDAWTAGFRFGHAGLARADEVGDVGSRGELWDAAGVAERPVEADGAAQVVHAEVGVADVERVEEAVEDVGVEVEAVADVERFAREAVAREVERDGALGLAELGEDVAVEVAAGWEAVEEEDWGGVRIGGACFEVVEAEVVDLCEVAGRLGHRVMMPASGADVTWL